MLGLNSNNTSWYCRAFVYLKRTYFWVYDKFHELYYGVKTKGFITPQSLGISVKDSIEYTPLGYRHIKKSLTSIPIAESDTCLLDFGCGKGRVLATAAQFKYKKIIGVEISSLVDEAQRNINSLRKRKVDDIQIKQGNAMSYKIPNDVNLIYFFNPFIGQTLNKVIKNIEVSLFKKERQIYIIYFNNQEFDNQTSELPWLQKISQDCYDFDYGLTRGIYRTYKLKERVD